MGQNAMAVPAQAVTGGRVVFRWEEVPSSGLVALSISHQGGITASSGNFSVDVRSLSQPIAAATVSATFPGSETCTWTCRAESGASCTAGPVTQALLDTVSMAASTRLRYELSCTGLTVGDAVATVTIGSTVVTDTDHISANPPFVYTKGDMDGDGRADLLLRHDPSGANKAWRMLTTTRMDELAISPDPASTDWMVVGVDNFRDSSEPWNDLLLWNSVTGQSELWVMNATSRVGSAVPLAGLSLPWKPAATADFDGDSLPDIIWRNSTTQKLEIRRMNGTAPATSNPVIAPKPDQAADANWEVVGAADLDGDRQTDLLWYNVSSGKIVYWQMKYSTSSAECAAQQLAVPCYFRVVGGFTNPANAGDANWRVWATGDFGIGPGGVPGTKDIVWRNATSGRFVVWFMDFAHNKTAGTFTTPDAPPAPAADWSIVGPR